jgi:hypothetical protein
MDIVSFQWILALLCRPQGVSVKVDGVLGSRTATAFERLRANDPEAMDSLRNVCGIPEFYIARSSLDVIVADILNSNPQYICAKGYLDICLDMENRKMLDGYFIDPTPPFVGIGQFDRDTWERVSDEPYAHATDVDKSVIAIFELYLANRRSFLTQFSGSTESSFTDEVAYLYHNQGASGARSFIRTGVLRAPKQSTEALKLFARI